MSKENISVTIIDDENNSNPITENSPISSGISEPVLDIEKDIIEEIEEKKEEEETDTVHEQNGHCFYIHTFSSPTYCNHCTEFIWGLRKQGLKCNCCGYVVHTNCKDKVNYDCHSTKYIFDEENPDNIQFAHYWLPGNTHSKKCLFCNQKTKAPKGGFDKTCKCVSCGAYAHISCTNSDKKSIKHFCKPQFANMLFCDELLNSENPPKEYKPLLVFVNHKSGGQQGLQVLKDLRSLLTPQQVISLLDEKPVGPNNALDKYGKLPNIHILVCGGDGTAGWVLQEMLDKRDDIINRDWIPPISVLPLGTGNDLARVLNWGGGYTNSDKLDKILNQIQNNSHRENLDRWEVKITPNDESAKSKEPDVFVLNNYFSIGLDAQIALQFHNMRESNPNLFKSRTVNKGIYGVYGVQKFVDAPPKVTDYGLDISVNDNIVENDILKKFQCIVWQNIPSYGGGSVLWSEDDNDTPPCKMDDGILEVVGLKSITHVLGIQTNIAKGTKVGQGSTFKIEITAECPIQVDGEPMIIGPSTIEIVQMNTAVMLAKNKK